MARADRRKGKKPRKRVSIFDILLYLILLGVLVVGGLVASFVSSAVRDLPALGNLEPEVSQTSFVYDCTGQVWTELHSTENRIPVRLSDLPKHMVDAVLAAEDHRFYTHTGVDLRAILRALVSNIKDKDGLQGGSTITQQLAKKQFLVDSRTWKRKVQDAILAVLYERKYTKDEILEKYLNQIPFGRGAYGIGAAAKAFFNKPPRELLVEEAAFLAGMIKGPYLYDPLDNPEGALARRNTILAQMGEYGFIPEGDVAELQSKPLNTVTPTADMVAEGAYFLDYVLKELLSKYPSDDVYGGGLRVFTTYDPSAQRAVEKGIADTLDTDFPYEDDESMQAAAIVMDVKTGHLLAMVGGRSHEEMLAWNRAVDTKRQPGSAFKPLSVYVPALEAGLTPALVVNDSPVTYVDPVTKEPFSPVNYDGTFSLSLTTMREAVTRSLNVIAVKVQDMIGLDRSMEYPEKLGITSLVKTATEAGLSDRTRSLALGGLTYGVSPMDMAVAFGAIANRGIKVQPIAILRIEDKNGNLLEECRPTRSLAISEESAYLMTSMLKDVIYGVGGTGGAAAIGRPAAGKTGTTSDWKDAWFCGYTPNTVGVVWMGFDQEKTMQAWKITGGSYPALMWGRMMKEITANEAPSDFVAPSTIVPVKVCVKTGELPGPACPAEDIVEELFPLDKVPKTKCSYPHGALPALGDPLSGENPVAPANAKPGDPPDSTAPPEPPAPS